MIIMISRISYGSDVAPVDLSATTKSSTLDVPVYFCDVANPENNQ
jgi:hypothetical protein